MSWSTESEIAFLRRIGMHTWRPGEAPARPETVIFLLEGYLEGAKLRRDWGKISKARALDFAEQMLKDYRSRADVKQRAGQA